MLEPFAQQRGDGGAALTIEGRRQYRARPSFLEGSAIQGWAMNKQLQTVHVDPQERRRAILALIVVNSLWATTFPIMKCLNLQMDQHFGLSEATASDWFRGAAAAWMLGLRFLSALLLFMLFFRRIWRRVGWIHVGVGVAVGTLFCAGMLFQIMGLGTIPASRSGFLTSLAVVFTPLLSSLAARRWPRLPILAAAVVGLLGVAVLTGLFAVSRSGIQIVSDALTQWTLGDTLTTCGACFFSLQILTLDRFGKRIDSAAITPAMFATTTLISAVAFFFLNQMAPETEAAAWTALTVQPRYFVLIIVLCIFPSLLAFVWMNKYQPKISAGQAAVLYTLEPLFASSWAMFMPAMLSAACGIAYANEPFTFPLLIGGALILSANLLALWPEKKRELAADPALAQA